MARDVRYRLELARFKPQACGATQRPQCGSGHVDRWLPTYWKALLSLPLPQRQVLDPRHLQQLMCANNQQKHYYPILLLALKTRALTKDNRGTTRCFSYRTMLTCAYCTFRLTHFKNSYSTRIVSRTVVSRRASVHR